MFQQYLTLGPVIIELPFPPNELEDFDRVDAVLQNATMRIDIMMEPGDLQLINKYAVMHSRTGFENFEEPQRSRKKLLLWFRCEIAFEFG